MVYGMEMQGIKSSLFKYLKLEPKSEYHAAQIFPMKKWLPCMIYLRIFTFSIKIFIKYERSYAKQITACMMFSVVTYFHQLKNILLFFIKY
jgi:hypothetical protein